MKSRLWDKKNEKNTNTKNRVWSVISTNQPFKRNSQRTTKMANYCTHYISVVHLSSMLTQNLYVNTKVTIVDSLTLTTQTFELNKEKHDFPVWRFYIRPICANCWRPEFSSSKNNTDFCTNTKNLYACAEGYVLTTQAVPFSQWHTSEYFLHLCVHCFCLNIICQNPTTSESLSMHDTTVHGTQILLPKLPKTSSIPQKNSNTRARVLP